ncbi:MAG: hypothetical protein DRO14_05720, partial [Thermoprotei archaeon]
QEALKAITIEKQEKETPFITIVKDIYSFLDDVFVEMSKRDPEISPISISERRIRNADEGIDKITELLNNAISILPQYEPLSFFIWSLWSAVDYYAEEYYPKLRNRETKDLLTQLGFTLEPQLTIGAIKVIGLRGIAIGIIGAILSAYRLTQLSNVTKYFSVNDAFTEYVNNAWSSVKEIEPNVRTFLNEYRRCLFSWNEYHLSPPLGYTHSFPALELPKDFRIYSNYAACKLVVKEFELMFRDYQYAIDLLGFLNTLAPLMMVRLANIREPGSNTADWSIVVPSYLAT